MEATATRLEFAPPASPGSVRALGLAVLAHALLLAALTWGVRWKNEPMVVTADAELWSAMPQQAAPRLIEVPTPVAVPRAPVAARRAEPEPPRKAVPEVPDANIVLERDKRRLAQEKLEKEKLLAAQKTAKLEKQAEEKQQADKRELDKKQADDKKKTELAAKRSKEALAAQEDAKNLEAQRQENIKRMAGLAGATGAADASGAALKSTGPSSGYGALIQARVRPNIVFTEEMAGNPIARIEVRASPDGTIISSKLLKSSGVPAWDEAVLRAIDKTVTLPRDVDGRVPPLLDIGFRPKN
jgi:colicin import membrane protein